METIKTTKKEIQIEYNKFCNDMLYVKNNKNVIEDFSKCYIEHIIGCFGFFDNDFFKIKDIEKVKKEIQTTLLKKYK